MPPSFPTRSASDLNCTMICDLTCLLCSHCAVRCCEPRLSSTMTRVKSLGNWRDGIRSLTTSCRRSRARYHRKPGPTSHRSRSEEHTSELQSLMCTSYAVFCLKKKNSIYQST